MIIGILLSNYKNYKAPTYIPLSNGEQFCGLVGKNGIGKSSILEALDCFFNNKPFKFNIHRDSELAQHNYIVPLFLIDKNTGIFGKDENLKEGLNGLSDKIWDLSVEENLNSVTYSEDSLTILSEIGRNLSNLKEGISRESHWLLPIGENVENNVSTGVFNDKTFLESFTEINNSRKVNDILTPIKEQIKNRFQYIYIPKDVEAERLIQFEREEMQALLGERLEKIIEEAIPKQKIAEISQELKSFINELSDSIDGYSFLVPGNKQSTINANKIYSLIIDSFFSVRELHKETSDAGILPLDDLSSGEKRQAIIKLISNIISNYREGETKNLILAIDEPESSLHVAACFDQFEILYNTSSNCRQLIFTSHWYGFIPAIQKGHITNIISNSKGLQQAFLFNIERYREEMKLAGAQYSTETHEQFPIDILLKSSNDFTQAIFHSVTNASMYNWFICEGSTDKIYLEHYLKETIEKHRLRIVPVATAKEVKNMYNRLAVLFEELTDSRFRGQLKGKVFLLTDTDESFVDFETRDGLEKYLLCRRIVNFKDTTDTMLVKIQDALKSPNTDIEDALNGRLYHRVLLKFKEDKVIDFDFIVDEEKPETPSYYSLDFRESERDMVDDFLNDNNGDNKEVFAKTYVELDNESYKIPNWIKQIKKFFDKE